MVWFPFTLTITEMMSSASASQSLQRTMSDRRDRAKIHMNTQYMGCSAGYYYGYNHGVRTPLSWNLTPTYNDSTSIIDIAIPFHPEWGPNPSTCHASIYLAGFEVVIKFLQRDHIPIIFQFTSHYTTIFVAYQHFPLSSIMFTWTNLVCYISQGCWYPNHFFH